MNQSKQVSARRIVLGKVSRVTEGGVYGAIEGAGLRTVAIQLS
jgi:hypothetical protein